MATFGATKWSLWLGQVAWGPWSFQASGPGVLVKRDDASVLGEPVPLGEVPHHLSALSTSREELHEMLRVWDVLEPLFSYYLEFYKCD